MRTYPHPPLSARRGTAAPFLLTWILLAMPANAQQTDVSATHYAHISMTVADMLHAIDLRAWDRVRAAFADRVYVDYTSLNGGEPGEQAADDLVGGWRQKLPGFDATQHLHGPLSVQVDGDRAEAFCAVTATHRLGDQANGQAWVVGGHYRMELRRSDGAWRISALTLETAYVTGDMSLPQQAQERASAQ